MAAFKLGANDITAVYLGSQGICIVNDGADNVFDDGCGAQFTVTHTISDGINGSQYTVSTVPSSSKTGSTGDPYSFTTTVTLNSNYRWQGGTAPTISPSQPITGVVGSANSTVTTTLSNATVELIPTGPNIVATLSLDTSAILGPAAGWYVTGDPDGELEVGNTSSVTYNFSSGAALNTDYEWVGSAPAAANSGTNTIYADATISTALGAATVRLIQYTVTQNLTNSVQGPSAGYNLTWNGNSNYTASTGTTTRSGTTGVSYSFPATTLGVNSNYTATQALTLSGEGAISGTFGTGSTTYSVTAGGTVALASSNVTVTLSSNATSIPGIGNATITGDLNGLQKSGSAPSQYQFTTSITPNSGYQYTGSNQDTGLVTYPASNATVTFNFTGQVSLIINDSEIIGTAEFSGSFYSKTAACNSTANSATVYFAGDSSGDPQPGTRLYLGSGLTSEIASGWFYNDDQGLPFYYSGGISYYDSC